MSVTRYRDARDMPAPSGGNPADPRTYARIKDLWRFSSRRVPALFQPGVYRYRSIDESQAARERATIERMRTVRAARTQPQNRTGNKGSKMISGEQRDTIVRWSEKILDGDTSVIEALRNMAYALSELRGIDAANVLLGVESETDEFPVGSQRSLWARDALAQKDEELAQYMTQVKDEVEAACKELISELDG